MEVKEKKTPDFRQYSEAKLLSIGKYAFLAAKLSSSSPLTSSYGKLSGFVIACLIVVNWSYLISQFEPNTESREFSPTETLILGMMSTSNMIVGIYFRIYSIRRRKFTLNFWHTIVNLMAEFFTKFPKSVTAGMEKKLSGIQNELRNAFLFLIFSTFFSSFPHILLVFIFDGYFENFGLSASSAGVVIAQLFFYIILFSHGGQAIWLSFFLKIYASLLLAILEKLKLATLLIQSDGFGHFETSGVIGVELLRKKTIYTSLEMEVNECYRMYIKVEKQLRSFSSHFEKELVVECSLGILNLVVYIFLCLEWFRDGSSVKVWSTLLLLPPIALFGTGLYNLGTEGYNISCAVSKINKELHHLYHRGSNITFKASQDIQMFSMKASPNSATVDASQYFVYNRHTLTTVSNLCSNN